MFFCRFEIEGHAEESVVGEDLQCEVALIGGIEGCKEVKVFVRF